jgi:hypothetical protein
VILRSITTLLMPLLVLAGCAAGPGTGGSTGPGPGTGASAVVHPAQALPESDPERLRIAAIDATSTLVPLGLNADGTVEVPALDQPRQAGWYRYGPTPGELGPSVLLGHVNAYGVPGVFVRLAELVPGDEVLIDRADGRTAVFTVTEVDQVAKTDFPTEAVYGDTATAELRLITCGGELDRQRHSYRDNIIVHAVLTGVRST